MARFTGKRVLITGGTSGIGLAGARRITAEGGQVLLTGIDPQRLDAARQQFPGTEVLPNDAADPQAAHALADAATRGGRLDGLWLNAGYADVRTVDAVDADFFDHIMATNVRGPALQMARLADHLNDGASVVVTSSTAIYEGAGVASIYAATKGALVAMALGWASTLSNRGIRVNVLVPGAISTRFRDFMSPELREKFERDVVNQIPLGRIGSAEEAAAVALFLLSDDSSYVTASQYVVDGGLTER